jgi:predicted GNAT family N-acyltransferase
MTRPFALREALWPDDEQRLRTVRYRVFVEEQGVPESLEWDGIDAQCRHLLALDAGGQPIGCGRLLPDGHVGRLAVLAHWRGRGVGAALLARLVALARESGHARVVLNAQTQALPFYARAGFTPCGPVFEEAGIAHQAMELRLAPA